MATNKLSIDPHDGTGTSLQGYLKASLEDLVQVFGEPQHGPNDQLGDKVTCEWNLLLPDGTQFTIYDWKERSTPTSLYEWHIGGRHKTVVAEVELYFSYCLHAILLDES